MRCPACGDPEDRVLDTRTNNAGTSIRRRRECLKCRYRFSSKENIEFPNLKVRKRDDSFQPFDLAKIERGLLRAMEKRRYAPNILENMLRNIEEKALDFCRESKEITSEMIATIVLEQLRNVDQVAYIRFASVCKKFETINQFLNEISVITGNNSLASLATFDTAADDQHKLNCTAPTASSAAEYPTKKAQ